MSWLSGSGIHSDGFVSAIVLRMFNAQQPINTSISGYPLLPALLSLCFSNSTCVWNETMICQLYRYIPHRASVMWLSGIGVDRIGTGRSSACYPLLIAKFVNDI